MLQLHNLSKTYSDGTTALHGVSLTIEAGEIITLVGPSGCGKSTLLRLIAGLDTPSTGQVMCEGRDITALPAERRGMGVVFQNYALFPNMTVADNIGFGLRVRGVSKSERAERVAAILDQIQLRNLANRRPDQLSGGQQQRVALGRALAIRPSVLLLDEPLTALDAQLREELRLELRHTLEQVQITSVYVTHDQAEALSLGDRVVVLRSGRIEQVGTPQRIYQQPATPFVAAFIGTANQLSGSVCQTPSGLVLETAYGSLPLPTMWQAAPGTPLTLLIRPEELTLSRSNEAHIHGRVGRLQFLGDRLRLFVQPTDADRELIVDVDSYTQVGTGTVVALRVVRSTPLEQGT